MKIYEILLVIVKGTYLAAKMFDFFSFHFGTLIHV